MQAILIILGIYLLYKFMTGFVIPIYRTTKRVQQQFRDVQRRAGQNGNTSHNGYNTTSSEHKSYDNAAKVTSKDYIDFEEVKD